VSAIHRHLAILSILVVTIAAGACSSQPATANEGSPPSSSPSAAPAASTPDSPSQPSGHEGFLEKVSCDLIRGWAWDPSQPDTAVTIELYEGDRLLKTTVAGQFRQDLLDARKGNGRHLFSESAPPEVRDGKPHAIRAVVKGTAFALRPLPDTPSSLSCAE
jgi:hypothetical protein